MNEVFSKDANEVIAEIKMEKTVYKGGFLLVEGDDDVEFWELRLIDSINNECVKIIKADGKFNAINAAKLLDDENEQCTIGVVDADFDHALNISLKTKRLVFTDNTDLEMMLISSSALEKLLLQNRDCLEYVYQKYQRKLLDMIFEYGVCFGSVRIFNAKYECGFKFDAIETHYVQFITIQKIKKSVSIKTILEFSSLREKLHNDFCLSSNVNKEELHKYINAIAEIDRDKVIRGKDMLEILYLLMHEANCGIKNKKDLFNRLNLAFEMMDLYKTKMFKALKQLDTAWNLNMLPDCA
jgi:hypothetical protein